MPKLVCSRPLLQLALGFSLLTSNAGAQDASSEESTSWLEPAIAIELRHNDNIFLSATDAQTSLITMLSPGLLAHFASSTHRFELEYNGEIAAYTDSSADNYDDHEFRAAGYLSFTWRSQLDLIGRYEDAHESRGTGLSEGCGPDCDLLLEEPDQYRRPQILGRFTYGATGTRGRLVFEAGQRKLDYTNHEERTVFFDHDHRYGGAAFYVRIMPNTSLLLDVRATEIEYAQDRPLQASLNSTEYRYLLGATWDITGKTKGTVKFGYVEKNYADDSRGKFSEPSWEVDIRWSPRSYSHFDLTTSRYPSEVTSLTGDVIDNTTYSLAWSHDWSERVMTRLATSYTDQEFQGSEAARLQKLREHGVTLAYAMRRWLTWEFGVAVSSRDSNIDQFDFDGTIIRLGAKLTL
ncbi:MAG: outer membrane beta-barrel protein [Gammaproteobacteria bacterium]|nr:outer membrane beta-barrel protein [Gammaproteobacteria bacterium]MDH3415328.1 outer membrane beta-barrel protein [Gammaproteobacteria bacterium]